MVNLENLENSFIFGLRHKNRFLPYGDARKATRILMYYYQSRKNEEGFDLSKEISEIWRGMKILRIDPWVDVIVRQVQGLSDLDTKFYHELDSLIIGLGVCVKKKLVNLGEYGTKYSLSAKGAEFLDKYS